MCVSHPVFTNVRFSVHPPLKAGPLGGDEKEESLKKKLTRESVGVVRPCEMLFFVHGLCVNFFFSFVACPSANSKHLSVVLFQSADTLDLVSWWDQIC